MFQREPVGEPRGRLAQLLELRGEVLAGALRPRACAVQTRQLQVANLGHACIQRIIRHAAQGSSQAHRGPLDAVPLERQRPWIALIEHQQVDAFGETRQR